MKILLTNDDGLRAPGIEAMHDALVGGRRAGISPDADFDLGAPIGDVEIAAPLTVQSATSHGVTFREPLMVRREQVNERMNGIAIDGRPADCVKLALSSIWPEQHGEGAQPDLLISGINAGANCGINVIYSGTVAAALEGAFLGVPSIAFSLHIGPGSPRFDIAARRARTVLERILQGGLPGRHECLSVNIPVTQEPGPMPEVVVCPMNTHGIADSYERRVSPFGDEYYWASAGGLDFRGTDAGSDVEALMQRKITVTPLKYDLTDHERMTAWRGRLG
jgi:5'-nucleotidase